MNLKNLHERILPIPAGPAGSHMRSFIQGLNKIIFRAVQANGVDQFVERENTFKFLMKRIDDVKNLELKEVLTNWLKKHPFLLEYREQKAPEPKLGNLTAKPVNSFNYTFSFFKNGKKTEAPITPTNKPSR